MWGISGLKRVAELDRVRVALVGDRRAGRAPLLRRERGCLRIELVAGLVVEEHLVVHADHEVTVACRDLWVDQIVRRSRRSLAAHKRFGWNRRERLARADGSRGNARRISAGDHRFLFADHLVVLLGRRAATRHSTAVRGRETPQRIRRQHVRPVQAVPVEAHRHPPRCRGGRPVRRGGGRRRRGRRGWQGRLDGPRPRVTRTLGACGTGDGEGMRADGEALVDRRRRAHGRRALVERTGERDARGVGRKRKRRVGRGGRVGRAAPDRDRQRDDTPGPTARGEQDPDDQQPHEHENAECAWLRRHPFLPRLFELRGSPQGIPVRAESSCRINKRLTRPAGQGSNLALGPPGLRYGYGLQRIDAAIAAAARRAPSAARIQVISVGCFCVATSFGRSANTLRS